LKTNGTPKTLADLRKHAIVSFTGISPNDEWRFAPEPKAAIRVHPRLVLNNADAGIEAVSRGLGIGRFLSYQVANAIAANRLVSVLDNAAPAPSPVHMLFLPNRSSSPNVRTFIEATRRYLKRRPL
jgi:DNA-binding transcriptional LysR family regulator